MLVGYFDDGDSLSEDDLPIAQEIPGAWQPGFRRESVGAAFRACPAGVIGLDHASPDNNVPARAQPVESVSCPVENMLRLALQVNNPQEYVPEPPRKRCRGKQKPELGTVLAQVLRSPSTNVAPHIRWDERRAGYHEFERRFALDLNTSVRTVRVRAKQLWGAASVGVRNNWSVLAQVCNVMYARVGARTRLLQSPAEEDGSAPVDALRQNPRQLSCVGALGTWMLDLGLNDPHVLEVVAAGTRGADLKAALQSMNLYQQAWQGFTAWVEAKCADVGFASHAASMELCLNGTLPHRVHVHAFFGPRMDFACWSTQAPQVLLELDDMCCLGSRPNMRVLRPCGRRRPAQSEAVGGMYYVLMEKPGSMFRAANRWPFQDIYMKACSD